MILNHFSPKKRQMSVFQDTKKRLCLIYVFCLNNVPISYVPIVPTSNIYIQHYIV